VNQGGYAVINRTWKKGDIVDLRFNMDVRRVISHPSVKETFGQYAFERGPLVYCLESADNAFDLDQLGVPFNESITSKSVSGLFGNTTVLEGKGFLTSEHTWTGKLFANTAPPKTVKFRAVPYCFWDNRGAGEMRVWVSPNPIPSPARGFEKSAKVTVSFKNSNSSPEGVNDGYVPASSNVNSPSQLHFWSHKGGTEWVKYSFENPITISSSKIYWFDDTGHGECKLPKSWVLQAQVGSEWKTIVLKGSEKFGVSLDSWNEVHFQPVTSKAFRILIEQQDKWSSGIHEWQIY
jgi:hypothetical protein